MREIGDYVVREIEMLGRSALIVRSRDKVLRAFHNVCLHRGNAYLGAARLHRENFAAGGVTTGDASSGAFEVRIASTGRIVPVPADRSIADALIDVGVAIPLSCREGVCGTCQTRVIGGELKHRDLYLTPEEQEASDQMLPCCSRARSPLLVLDL